MAGPGGDSNVEVKFGGSTTGLDAASNKAVQDVEKVGKSTTGLGGIFRKAGQGFKSFVGEIKGGWAEGWKKGVAEAIAANNALDISSVKTAASVGSLGGTLLKFAGAAAAALSIPAIVAWGQSFGDAVERLDQTAAKLGMTSIEVSKWNSLAVTAGLNTEAFASSAGRLERSMVMAASGGKQQQAVFRALGIDITKTRTTSEALLQISDKFSTMADGPKKTALAIAALGRTGAELIPILNGGREALEAQFKTADELGAVVNERFLEAGRAVDEASDTMTLGLQGVQNTLFTELGPAIAVVINYINGLIKGFMESYRSGGVAKTMIDAIVISFKIVVSIITGVITGFQQLWHIGVAALQGILGTIYTVGSALGKLLSGDFSGVRDAWVNGFRGTGRAMAVEGEKALDLGRQWQGSMRDLWSAPTPTGPKPAAGGGGDLAVAGLGGGGGKPKGKTAEQLAREARRIAEEALRDQLEDLSYQMDMARDNYDEQMRLEEEKLAKLKEFYGADSREYIRELRTKEKMERDHQLELVRLAQQRITALATMEQTRLDTDNQLAQIELAKKRDHFGALDQMGAVSGRQRIDQLRQFAAEETALQAQTEQRIFEIKAQSIRDQLALANLPLEQQRALTAQLEQLTVEHEGRMAIIRANAAAETARINDQAAAQTLAKWQGIVDPISSALDGFLGSMMTKSATFGQALLQMGDSILQSFVSMGVKALAKWVAMELAKTSATSVGVATRTGVEAAGAATSNTISAMSAIKQIAHKAAVAAAGAYAAIASIPIVGPFLAPAAAAAALFGVYKLGQMVFSAKDGEGEVPYDGAQYTLHKKEMVLPAKFATPLRSMLAGGGPQLSGLGSRASEVGSEVRSQMASSRGGDSTFNYQPTHNNQDTSLDDLLRKEGSTLRKWFRNEVRNNKFGMLGEPA